MDEVRGNLFMCHPQHDSCSDPTEPDDVDRLFNRLAPLEPPKDLIARILDSVAHISRCPAAAESLWDHDCRVNGLVVRNEKQAPS